MYGSKGKDHVTFVQGSRKVPHYQEITLVYALMFPLENRVGLSVHRINKKKLRLLSPWILAYISKTPAIAQFLLQ